MYDLVIKECQVVDPKNGLNRQVSIGISNGVVAEIADDINSMNARQVLRFPGKLLMPGLIDTHMHCSPWSGGPLAFSMMAKAGVTTGFDFSGPVSEVIKSMKEWGSGINIAVLNANLPGQIPGDGNELSYQASRDFVNKALAEGALGIKMVGGHYPLSPAVTRNLIKAANEEKAYVAFHAGSTKNGSNLSGMMDAIDFSEGRPLHLAHINAYCRGAILGDVIEEVKQAMDALKKNRNIISETHLAPLNGTSGVCIDGIPQSHVTRTCLQRGGFAATEEGLKNAFLEGWAYCNGEKIEGENIYLNGTAALDYWVRHQGNCQVCFPVNNRTTAFLCATYKDEEGHFVVDAISTDGGGLPRNFLLKYGLQLVEWGACTIEEFVSRTSYIPSLMMGLTDKGHLTQGADADITVVDLSKREAVLTIVGGDIVYANGIVTGKGGVLLCTERGEKTCNESGIEYRAVDLTQSMLYKGRPV